VHTIAGEKGDIYITFSGTYNMTNSVVPVKLADGSTVDVQPLTTGPDCTWVILAAPARKVTARVLPMPRTPSPG
jgi:hypothetical protein